DDVTSIVVPQLPQHESPHKRRWGDINAKTRLGNKNKAKPSEPKPGWATKRKPGFRQNRNPGSVIPKPKKTHGQRLLLMTPPADVEAVSARLPVEVSTPPEGPVLPEQPVRPAMVKLWFKLRIARPDSVNSFTIAIRRLAKPAIKPSTRITKIRSISV